MDILSLVISLLLGGVALVLIFYPLWQQTRPAAVFRVDHSGQTLEEYEARYRAALAAIKDLMFDHEMGKVSTEDYEILLHKSKLEAAHLRQQIDRLNRSAPAAAPALEAEIEALIAQTRASYPNGDDPLRQEVEAEIEALKHMQAGNSPVCPTCGKPYHPADAFCAGCGQSLADLPLTTRAAAVTCPVCNAPIESGDAFCASCGAALAEPAPTTSGAKT